MRARASLATLLGAFVALLLMQMGAVSAAAELRIEFDGQPASFEAPPVDRGGVICVPMKGVFGRLGAVVNYDDVTKTVKAWRGKTVILLTLGKDTATVNLKPHKLQVAPFPLNGAIMVPLRFVGEALGAAVSYDVSTHVVSIRSPKGDGTITLPTVRVPPESPTPSAAPSSAPSPEIAQITEFRHGATTALHPGDTLTVTMVGTPRGQASFAIPGITEKAPLKEGPDGTYTCDYKLPAGVAVKAAPVYGILQVGASRAPLATAPNLLTVQPLLPHIERPAPAPGATVTEKTPRIAGFFEVLGGSLDPATVRVSVNGADVTRQAYVTREFFTYTPPQPLSGRVKVDVAGRATVPGQASPLDWSDSWSFEIQGGVARIQSATHGPTSVYKSGDVVEVTMIGTAGGTATFDVGTVKRGVEMREASSGTYIGAYRVQATDRVDSAPVVVRLRVGGDEVVAQVPIPVTLGVGVAGDSAMPLTVTTPRANEAITKTIVVRGQSAPGVRVKVDVTKTLPIVGSVRVAGAEATADGQGTYTVNVQLPMVVGGVKLTLVVTASDASGKTAGPVMVPVVGK